MGIITKWGQYALCALLLLAFGATEIYAQDKLSKDKDADVVKYRRSSLHTMMIEGSDLPKKEIIVKTFTEAEFPDKYNNHTCGDKFFKLSDYQTKKIEKTGNAKEDAAAEDKGTKPAIERFIKESKLANKLIAKWFNRSEDGAFDMSLIQERGFYDASALDVSVASGTERGISRLADAGIDLIANTFVVVNKSKFESNEPYARAARDIAFAMADSSLVNATSAMDSLGPMMARKAAEIGYNRAKDGYSVWTTAYLYQLEWNDSVEAVFYMDMWMDSTNIDSNKKARFDSSDLFTMKLLGYQRAKALVTGLGKNAQNPEMAVKSATIKSIDAVYAKLQRKFEPFRTKTPLISTDPIAAKIGMKEGLEKNDKYEVLEMSQDEEGKTIYKRKGIIKVQKNAIWDNRFGAQEEKKEGDKEALEFTTFKGKSKGLYPGMLIRQIN